MRSCLADSLGFDLDMPDPILPRLEQVTTITGQLHAGEGQNSLTQGHPEARNGSTSSRWQDFAGSPSRSTLSSRATSTALYSSSSRYDSGHLGFLWRRDGRSEAFVDSFLFWLDTVELVRVAGEPSVFYTAWVFPIYILAFMSTLRMAIAPNNTLLSFVGVALQDLPFFIIRVALIVVFGYVTPVLYPLKNVLVSLTFIYFTFLTKLKIFKNQGMFWGGVAHSGVNERSALIVDGWTVGIFMCGERHQRKMVLVLMMKKNVFCIAMAVNVLWGHSSKSKCKNDSGFKTKCKLECKHTVLIFLWRLWI